MSGSVRNDLVLSHAVATAEVSAPLEYVDIEQWLKTLPTHDSKFCVPAGLKAPRYASDDDGTPLSANVDVTGSGAVTQHYRYDVASPHYCKMVSLSGMYSPAGWSTTQVIWELGIEQLQGDRLRYVNTVTLHPTEDFLTIILGSGQTFEDAAAARQRTTGEHCLLKTPHYAQSIAAFAVARASNAAQWHRRTSRRI